MSQPGNSQAISSLDVPKVVTFGLSLEETQLQSHIIALVIQDLVSTTSLTF